MIGSCITGSCITSSCMIGLIFDSLETFISFIISSNDTSFFLLSEGISFCGMFLCGISLCCIYSLNWDITSELLSS